MHSRPPRSSGTSLDILKGLDWAGKSKANIVNMSFAGPADAELQAMLKALRANGVVLIAAVGNAGPRSPPLYPAADPNVIAVSATDMDDKPFAQANRGTHIAVAAPGVSILAAAPDGGYQMPSGTSSRQRRSVGSRHCSSSAIQSSMPFRSGAF